MRYEDEIQKQSMTKKEKSERAKARVSDLYRVGDLWGFSYWPDGPSRPAREMEPMERATAIYERSRMLVAFANDTDGSEFDGGSWRDYVRPDPEIALDHPPTR